MQKDDFKKAIKDLSQSRTCLCGVKQYDSQYNIAPNSCFTCKQIIHLKNFYLEYFKKEYED